MIAKQGRTLRRRRRIRRAVPRASTAAGGRALDVLPTDQFEALIRMGRAAAV